MGAFAWKKIVKGLSGEMNPGRWFLNVEGLGDLLICMHRSCF